MRMAKVIFTLLIILSIPASLFAAEGYNIYPGGYGQQTIKNTFNIFQMMQLNNPNQKEMFVANGCSQPLAFTCTTQLITPVFTAPANPPTNSTGPFTALKNTTNPFQIFVPATSVPNPFAMGACPYVWVRSADPNVACSAGNVSIDFW